MSLFSKITSMSRKAITVGVVTAAVVGFGGLKMSNAGAQNIAIGGPSDCDTNAVMYCGAHSVNKLISNYNNGDGHNSAGAIKNIYNYFGISQNEIRSMDSGSVHVESGKVSKSGNVYDASGQVIATDAVTAGRSNIAGSNSVNNNGTHFYTRPPSVSFLSNTLDAYVVTVNGQFSYAILAACGNPVKAHPKPKPQPQPKPAYNIEKQIKEAGSGDNFSKSIKVKPGDKVVYSVVVKSTGDSPVKNVVVKDNLPNNVKYVANSLTQDGNNVGNAKEHDFFAGGVTLGAIPAGQNVRFTFQAIVAPDQTPEKCHELSLRNVASINAPNLPIKSDNADVGTKCQPPKPAFACEKLDAIALSRMNYNFKAKSSTKDGATVVSYTFNFGDGQSVTVPNKTHNAAVKHSYPNLDHDATYTAKVVVTFKANGKTHTDSGPTCTVPVTVKAQPAAECTNLTLTVGENRSVTAQVEVATKNGAQLNNVNYDFDDGTTLLVNDTNSVSHTYAADGDYTVKATVTFDIGSTKETSVCQAPVSFVPPNTPTCEEMSPTGTCETCEEASPTGTCEHTPTCEELAESDSTVICTPGTTTPPTNLVNTGPGSAIAIFAATAAIGSLGYRKLLSRSLS